MSAPELAAQRSESAAKTRGALSQKIEGEARVGSIRAQRLEAEAKLASDEATYKRLKAASATPGVVAGNDVEVAEKLVEADRARVKLYEENEKAARAQVISLAENAKAVGEAAHSVEDIESYLHITAPFDGVVTERNVHKGSLVGPSGGPASTTERVFVIRIRNGATEWVDVKRGVTMGDLIEVFGLLDPGDEVAVRGTDELREGTQVIPKQPPPK